MILNLFSPSVGQRQTREEDMPTIRRALADDVLRFHLDEEAFRLRRTAGLARSGRTARTLVKDGSSRVTLVGLGANGRIPEHHAEGPITILPFWGRITVTVEGEAHALEPGDLLALGARVPHSVESTAGGVFLLTVAACSGDSREQDLER
jgi:quercetin dioxygenase-like cupin family protein